MPGFIETCLLLLSSLAIYRLVQGATPVFRNPDPSGATAINIDESTVTGFTILTANATDADSGTITYTLASQTPSAKFTISGSVISTSATFDYEDVTDRTYTLTVQAVTDSDGSNETVSFIVNINDVNDETPQIDPGGTFTASVNEEAPTGTAVGVSYLVTDADDGDTFTYSITGDTTYFQIDSATGAITTNQVIDFETAGTSTFSLTLTVSDSAMPTPHSVTQALTITLVDINDNTPVFNPATYYATVEENTAAATSVVLLTATDADAGSIITYAIASGDDATTKFVVNGSQIETSSTAIDYDVLGASNYKYTLVVTADDTANTATATVIVTITGVNEADPTWATFSPAYTSATTPYSLSEDASLGTSVVTIQATDTDAGTDGDILYTISSITNSGSGLTSGLFHLDQVTGELTTTSTSFDRDTATGGNEYYDLVVRATDRGDATGGTARLVERTVRVGLTDVNDNDPTFTPSALYTHSMAETTVAGTSLLTVQATDDDVTSTLTYTLETSSTPSSYSTHFEMDGTTTNQINLKAVVNLDSPDNHDNVYTLHIKVVDGGTPERSSTATVIITVTAANEHTPTFAAAPVTSAVDETASVGTAIASMAATDYDTGNDGVITYSISAGNTNSTFTIDPATGEVKVAASLDFETSQQYILTILAKDGGSSALTGTATLTININDVNDETPQVDPGGTFTASINEEAPTGTAVGVSYTVTDDDAGDTFTYSITGDTTYFQIDSATGDITTNQVIDFETAGTSTFSLTLTVSDSATPTPHSVTQALTITLVDINDNTPVFNPATYYATVEENTAAATSVVLLTAMDADGGSIITYSIASGDDATAKFVVNVNQIETSSTAIDYDVLGASDYKYTLVVTADDTANTATATVIVTITGKNEADPTWATFSPAYTSATTPYSLSEDASLGTSVVTIQATDTDAGTDGDILYTISSITNSGTGLTSGRFHLDQVTGVLTTTSTSFNRDIATGGNEYYDLVVRATDRGDATGSTARWIERTMRVGLTDVNDNDPTFTPSTLYTHAMAETTVAGTSLLTVLATDDDITSTLTYSLETTSTPSSYSTHFEMDGTTTNQINLKAVVNLDSPDNHDNVYTLHIKVVDGGTPERSSTATVVITVTAANDHTPTFAPASITSAVDETASVGTAVASMAAIDDDTGNDGVITYSISAGNTNSKFTIDPATGEVKVAASLNFETRQQYILTVLAKDGGTSVKTGTATLTVDINDISDEAPSCTTNSFAETVSELTNTGITIVTLDCSDRDANDTLAYSIPSGNTGSKFIISTAGVLTLNQLLDYDTGDVSYKLTVQVTDGTSTLEIPVVITIDPVNEATPAFVTNPTVSVAEDETVGTILTTYSATDSDASPHGIVKYQIIAGGSNKFSIDQRTGAIRLAQTLDYESVTSYVLTVEAEDGGTMKGTGTVIIAVTNVNDVTPTCTSESYVLSVAEDTGVGSDIISDFSCSDSDGGTLTYTINSAGVFNIDTTTTPKLILNSALDFETTTAYQLEVTVSDGSLSTVIYIDISVTDVNEAGPVFNPVTYTESISESTAISTSIVTITATDVDSPTSSFGKLSYSFVSGNTDSKFSIDPSSGKVTVAGVLDADTTASYTLVIQAIEEAMTNSASATLAVTVTQANDNSPTCTSGYSFSVSFGEPGAAGDVITTLTCTDADGDTLTYTITTGTANFQMNANVLELKAAIDYDTPGSKQYQVTIQVSDGSNTVDVDGSVTVTSVNEHIPAFTQGTYTASHAEDSSPGTTIATVSATDGDIDASVEYSWVAAQTHFTLDQVSGVILLAANLDREVTPSYNLLVTASDGVTTVTATVTVTVTDVNDNTPVFNPTSYSGSVAENAAAGLVLTVTATDLDDPATSNYGTVAYRIASGGSGLFSLNSVTGVLSTTASLNYETATSYTLYIEAYDSSGGAGARTSTNVVTVTVTPENEFDPAFTSYPYSATTAENTAIGTSLLQVSATDADDGEDGVIYFSMMANSNFYLDTDTGEIFVKQTLNFESATSHTFDVVAHDSSGSSPRSVTTAVTITVTDVNDIAPRCSPRLQTVAFEEVTTTATAAIASFSCSDGDALSTLDYAFISINGAPSDGTFSLDSVSGDITLAGTLDYESTASYSILVMVRDNGTPFFSTTATVQVTVTDYNEHDPVFNPATYTTTISETTSSGTSLLTVTATDADTDNTVTYTISPASTVFAVDSSRGVLVTTATIDYDTLTAPHELEVVIEAADDGSNPSARTTTVTATVTITDSNDNTPIFNPGVYTAQVSENDPAGTTVTTVTATDIDGTTPTYSLANDFTIFRVDANGEIVINTKNQDYETATSYALVVYATDPALNTGTATIHITITNYNEHTPVLPATNSAVSIPENSALGTSIVDVNATDADSGVDGIITYSISSTTAGYETTFAIVPTTGVVAVAGDLDMETVPNPITVVVDATDGGTNPAARSAQFTLTLTITDENDNTPVCATSLYTASVAENIAANTSVANIHCTDADTDAPNNDITYSITSGNTAGKFSIDMITGEVTISTGESLDRELADSYLLVAEATDGGTPALTGTTTLTVTVADLNDNDPMFASGTYAFTVSEAISLGTNIGQVSATDADIGLAGSIYYSIVNGNLNSNMAIDSNTGDITSVGAFDYEFSDTYALEVHAIDKLATFRTGTTFVTITVTDVNDVTPTCSPALQTVAFAENTALNTPIATVMCTDTDTGVNGDVSYVIATVDGAAVTSPFSIVTGTGVISLTTSLDYEADKAKTIVVHGIDGGSLTGSATVNVIITAVNEAAPVFTGTPYTQSVVESTAVSTSVFQVTATDTDDDDTLTYSISPASTVFNIDPADGTIYLIDTLDSETTSSYMLTVIATDAAAQTATATVTIAVTDTNDERPVFNPAVYIASIPENSNVGATVTTVIATDADSGTPTYSIFSGNNDGVFRIEANGEILIDDTTTLDYDSATKSYTLVVHGTDGTYTASTTVAVTVTNVNDNPPLMTSYSSTKTFDEDLPVGTSIATITATDQDHGGDGDITYSITAGNGASRFSVDPSSGEVTLAGELDMEATQTYVLTIDATDAGTNPGALTAQHTLTILVADVNDVTPVCTQSLYSVSVPENTLATTSVLRLDCSDNDQTSPNSDISLYNIVSGNTGAAFSTNAVGDLLVNTAPDRETLAAYTLVIQVIDAGTNPAPLTTTTTVAITITDENDNTPASGADPYGFAVGEESPTGTVVGTVAFTDTDDGGAGTVTFSINSGNVDTKFEIDSSTGEIQMIAAVDYETATVNPYELVIYGTDAGTTPRTSSTTVSITVLDYNDNTPTCSPALNNVQFPENTAAATTIDTLACSDDDGTSPNNDLSYTIVSVNGVLTPAPFDVDASGVVTLDTGQNFDFETMPAYNVLVRVRDGGTPSLSFTATINVDITNVNEAAPVFQSTPYATNVQEISTIGTNVYTVTAIDSTDTSETISYSISPVNTYFGIDPVTGMVSMKATVDYDTLATNPIILTVVATDNGTPPMSSQETLTITVIDNNDVTPSFNPGVYTATVSEEALFDTTITTVTVVDADDTSWTMSFASGNGDSVFRIDPNGDIVVNDVSSLDYDSAIKSYVLVAQAVDSGLNTGTATVNVQVTNVNEHTPVLAAATNSVALAEDSAIGTSVDDVDAIDADHGADGTITYSIDSVTNNGDSLFTIDPTSGLVRTSGELDRETQSTYTLTIIASDAGTFPSSLNVSYTLVVTVTDVNDVTPVCTPTLYAASVAEDATTGTSVAQLACTDGDAEANNNVINMYTITTGNTGTAFSLTTGGLVTTTAAGLDRESLASYTLVVEVADSGASPLTTTTTVKITVTDLNDNDPVFLPTSYNLNYNEDTAVGTTIGTVTASDDDTGDAGLIVFSIVSGDDDSKFTLDSSTGDLVLTAALDFETATNNPYILTIHAVDSDSTPRTGTGTIIVTVADVNDNTPVCSPPLVSLSYIETTPTTTTLTTLNCNDADSGTNGVLAYTILSVNGSASAQFTIDASGAIRLSLLLDYETEILHTILVEVRDGGATSLSTTATVNVHVIDYNDNTPVFSGLPYSVNVIENTAVGTTVFSSVTATDDDVGDTVTYAVNPPLAEFDVDPNSGNIILKTALDYDAVPNTYDVILEASDGGTPPLNATATVTIAVTNFNDGTPEFNPGVYAITVSEDAANLATLLTLTITDIDTDNTAFTYNIQAGNTDNIFDITGTDKTPDLIVDDNTLLDYEGTQSYSLVITASDGSNTGSATVAIEITGINEHAPQLASTASTQTVAEDAAIGHTVVDIDASDADRGTDGSLVFTIVSGASGKFAVDPSSGVVTVSGSLDMETTQGYTVLVEVADQGTNPGMLSATYTLSVAVLDVNDMTPVCTSSLYGASLSEDAGTGTTVAQLVCTDADISAPNNDITTYTVTSGNTGGEFLISTSGEVTTAAVTFDREVTPSYQLVIEVSDNGVTPSALTTTTTLTVEITDVNDNTPVFSLPVYNINIDEDTAIHSSIGIVTATDADIDLAGSMVYSIASGNGDGKFALDRTTGEITLAASVDYETTTTNAYVLTVHATDRQATFRTGTATVSITLNDVNDNIPTCTASLYAASVAEDSSIGTSVITLACSDNDAISTVTYSTTSAEFDIDPTTGQIDTAASLDVETTASYDFTVTVSDGTLSSSVDVSITVTNVNDLTPAFSPAGPYNININENEDIGYTVFDVNATDGDVSGTTFIFSITGGNTDGVFTIGTSSGIIQQHRSIDRDDPLTLSYTLTLKVADGSGANPLTATTSIVISINDLNDNYPSCDSTSYFNTISELSQPGLTVFTPICSDLDTLASPTLHYNLTGGNDEDKFLVNGGSGVVTLKALIDYETTTSYTLTVTVEDQGTPNLVTKLYMTIYVDPANENTPVFTGTPYDKTIRESRALGYQVVRVSATDADIGSTHGDVRYAITSGNSAGHFSIDASTGWVTVSGSLDRESTASYALSVEASDMLATDVGALTATNVFTITIQDVNDNYPQINPATYATSINENVATPASIVQIQATDDDEGMAGTAGLQFSVTGGNTGNVFSMSNDWVVLSGDVDAASVANYVLTVKVKDQGTPVLSAFTLVSISITAVNEHAPNFTVTADTVTVSESETVGNSLYQVPAFDDDTGNYANLRFYLVSGNSNNEFSVDLFNGDVRVANSLDYDAPPTVYTLLIEVEDTVQNLGGTLTSTFTLTVSLLDSNDETPIFTQNTYSGSVDENVATSTSVLTVTANDADSGTNSIVTYTIISGTGSSTFSIDSSTGVISTAASINFETDTQYDLVVRAEDQGTSPLSSTCLVRITVNDLNDNTPVFSVTNVAVTISENVGIGTTVATALATDADSSTNNNNVITFAFSVASARFAINSATAVITTTDNLDRDTTPSHTLTVIAVDGGGTPNTASSTYTIVLSDINDNDPTITGTPYDVTFPEDTAQNTIVMDIQASDIDEDENAVLTYSINSGDTNSDFFIDPGTGIIQISKTLDRETIALYTLEVMVVDSGTPARSAIVSATVTVGDVNDNAPVFQPDPITTYTFNVSENVPVGTSVDRVSASDADTGLNAAVQYTIARYITGDNTHFSLDVSSGVITTAATLDRETQDIYSFIVRASDSGTSVLTSSVTVVITIGDYNDNIPSFSQTLYTATTTENQPAGTSILTVVIDDIDIDVNDDITLTINTSTTAGARADLYIYPNSSSSILTVKQPIDRETDSLFSFVLIATDGGTPPLSFSTSIEITVGDANDNNPVFSPTFYNSEIPYNDNCQVTATTITATDEDEGVNAAITYSVTQNNNPHLFTLDSSTGAVTIVATPAVDTGYILYASASDGGNPALSSSSGATIRVDTYAPSERILNYYMSISEATFLVSEATFLSQLTTVYRQTYPTAQAKRWCTAAITDSSCVARIYVIEDDSADDITELTNDKQLLTVDEAYAVTAKDEAGTPADDISGVGWTSFVITKVEKYQYIPPVEDSTPWVETTTGILVLVAIGVVILIAILAGSAFAFYKYRDGLRR